MAHLHSFRFLALAILALALASSPDGRAATPADLLAGYSSRAGASAVAARGQQFFTSTHGREWSCGSCHGAAPVGTGKHAVTGKAIKPLSPAANPERLTDAAKIEKWLERNCKWTLGRPCTPQEKGDVLVMIRSK
ncbi:MAG TPA: DUF1924 domain-containing protein [Usitatibacter sp.]|nr:DUF1924 domain-containing protein [Usitatibacter sp.]